jgi:acyl carrier protein
MESIAASRLERLILNTLRSMAGEPDHVDPDAGRKALDIDSLDLVELAQVVEDERDVAVPPVDLRGAKTVRDIIDRYLAAAA